MRQCQLAEIKELFLDEGPGDGGSLTRLGIRSEYFAYAGLRDLGHFLVQSRVLKFVRATLFTHPLVAF